MTDTPSVGSKPGTSSEEELNPLLNPILEQNLSRWAQVYFTTPPETRDRAVRDLLQQLRAETTVSTPPPSFPAQPVSAPASEDFAPAPPAPLAAAPSATSLICSNCQSENAPDQQFCGFCGDPLSSVRTPQPRAAQPETVRPDPGLPHVETLSFLGLDSNPADDHELQFLRKKSFETEYDESESGPHRGRYAVAVIIILAGIAYLEWPSLRAHLQSAAGPARSSLQAPAMARTEAPPAVAPLPSEPQPAVATDAPPQAVTPAAPAAPTPQAASPSEAQNAAPSPPPAKPLTLASRTEVTVGNADGTQELLQAQRYLDGRGVPHNSVEAAALLWKAVGKQNTQADLLLADLYLQGDGVSKNCGQARMLLVAAAKKNAPGASEKLRRLESSGCQ